LHQDIVKGKIKKRERKGSTLGFHSKPMSRHKKGGGWNINWTGEWGKMVRAEFSRIVVRDDLA